jgi:hypothetical protein
MVASFLKDCDGPAELFEVLVRTKEPMKQVVSTLEQTLGPSEQGYEPGVRRWKRGASTTTVTRRGGHTAIRAFHEPRSEAYAALGRQSCGGKRP